MRAGTLIVGGGQAGLQLAVSLRQLGDTSPIALVGEEVLPPYQRPPLSKEFLAGRADLDSLALRNPAFYPGSGIDLVCGERVTGLRMSSSGPPGSGVATTTSGRELPFDRLALTVGADARRLPVPGHDLDGVCYLRHHDDAADLRARLATAADVVVVGGGFIGLEVAAAARSAWAASFSVCTVLLVPTPATTVARSPTASMTVRRSRSSSASVVVGDSPVVPLTTRPSLRCWSTR